MLTKKSQQALSGWENEGGSTPGLLSTREKSPKPGCLPSLPSGYESQPICGFRDRTSTLLYEFNRVYKPTRVVLDRGLMSVRQLDEDLSFWVVTWATPTNSGDELPEGRWVTYEQARSLHDSHLSFEQFSDPTYMGQWLQANLHAPRVTTHQA